MDMPEPTRKPKLLFSSYHSYFDPSSGAALSTRDLLELLVTRGGQCRALSGIQLDFEEVQPLDQLLGKQDIAFEERRCTTGPMPFSVYHFQQGGIPVTTYVPDTQERFVPSRKEGLPFLALFERMLARFQPDILLTYGGDWLARELIALAKRQGAVVVFTLQNLAYSEADLFRQVDGVLVPSEFAKDYYRRTLGIECTAIPGPFNWTRALCPEVRGQYVTFTNPQPTKGVFWFVRIATELGRQRPDIPLLIVEGRGKVDWLKYTGHDLSDLRNLHWMRHTPDPRDFYKVSKMILMPSLWLESFPRTAAEALMNGIPVLGSRRGGLPEPLADAGFLFDVPEQYTAESRLVPNAEEVAPWLATIIRLWDDAEFYESERRRCLAAAEAWRRERLVVRYEEFFVKLLSPR